MNPVESAFNKLYLVNLFLPKGQKKQTFAEAKTIFPTMGRIAEKLTETELRILIRNIESIL